MEADVNFSKVFGINDEPEEKIKQAEELALQRCPVVFTLKNPVKLVPSLEILNE